MTIDAERILTVTADTSTKRMCKELAKYYLLHGIMVRTDDILRGAEELRYISISSDTSTYVSEIDSSIVPYLDEYGSRRFHLGRYQNEGLGIIDSQTNRFYPLNPENDPNLKWAKHFADLMEKDSLEFREYTFLAIMHGLMPLFEWCSDTSHRLFKSFG